MGHPTGAHCCTVGLDVHGCRSDPQFGERQLAPALRQVRDHGQRPLRHMRGQAQKRSHQQQWCGAGPSLWWACRGIGHRPAKPRPGEAAEQLGQPAVERVRGVEQTVRQPLGQLWLTAAPRAALPPACQTR